MESNRRRLLFITDRLLGHVTMHIRGLIYEDLLTKNGWTVRYVDRRPESDIEKDEAIKKREKEIVNMARGFDLVYLLKAPSLPLIKQIKKKTRAKTIFDLTDALWKPHFRSVGWSDLEGILEQVDAVFSENEYICAYGRKFNRNVFSIPACTQVELFDEARKKCKPRNDGRIRIGWIGSPSTMSAIRNLQEPLERLFACHPNLELRVVGCGQEGIPAFRNVRCTAIPSYNEEDMIREVLSMDVGIFPPPFDEEDYTIRGALKAMIYMSGGLPVVCFRAGDCEKIIQDGINGMLASNDEEWESKLHFLVNSKEVRQRMGESALDTIRQEHSIERVFAKLQEALVAVANQM